MKSRPFALLLIPPALLTGLTSSTTNFTTYHDGIRGPDAIAPSSWLPTPSVTTWGAAKEIPGLASLPGAPHDSFGGATDVRTISCATIGYCAAGGFYWTSSDPTVRHPQGFVVDESSGVWGVAQEVPGLGRLNVGLDATVESVSCAAAGSCAAGGYYTDAGGAKQGFVVDEIGGVWGTAQIVPGLGALNTGGTADVRSVSCSAVGACAAVGHFTDTHGAQEGFVVDESGGIWGAAHGVPGLGALATFSVVLSVSCASAGDCGAGGSYLDSHNSGHGFVVTETSGTWSAAHDVPGLGALNVGDAGVASISCTVAGDCAAGGYYTASGGAQQAFVVDESSGTWAVAQEVPGLGALNVGGTAFVTSVSCAAADECAAGGWYFTDAIGHEQGFVLDESNGIWGRAQEIPGLGPLNIGRNATVESVSCGAAGNCAAGGDFSGPGGAQHGFVVNESSGSWGRADMVPGLDSLDVRSISCASADHCAAVGDYAPNSGPPKSFVALEPGAPPFCSPMSGLTAAITSHRLSDGYVFYRIRYTNRGDSGCELAGIPGALGYTTKGHVPLGPPAKRTVIRGRGNAIYLDPLVGKAETMYVIHVSVALRSRSCRPGPINVVIIRPMGIPQILVPIYNPKEAERLICQGLRNEAIYGFVPAIQQLT